MKPKKTNIFTNIKFLIIEDSKKDTFLLKRRVAEIYPNAEIYNTKTMRHALRALKMHEYTAIILDLNLPDCVGPKTVEMVRALSGNIPIIVMTSFMTKLTASEVKKYGANDILSKNDMMTDVFIDSLHSNACIIELN